jgi:hypothetical protein
MAASMKMAVFRVVASLIALMMEAARKHLCNVGNFYQTTRRNNAEDSHH